MPGTWRTVRVFISSTFRDMQAERDHLVQVVFPALRERLEKHRVHLLDIDLRWGVTREQAENRQILGLCLQQVEECRPFFLGLLGERYGWKPTTLPADAVVRYPWLAGQEGRSVTELEFLHGGLRQATGGSHALFCLRDPAALQDVPEPLRSAVYQETDPEARGRLARLKESLRGSGYPVLDAYPCRWAPDEPDRASRSRGRFTGLGLFGNWVRDCLWEALRAELALSDEVPNGIAADPFAEEAEAHERFLESRLRVYASRDEVHQALLTFVRSTASVPCLLTGPSGSGKSAVLARFVAACREQEPRPLVVPYFVGAGLRSTGLRDLLRHLARALQQHFDLEDELPEEVDRLAALFPELLWRVPAGQRVVLVLDGVNQLDECGQAQYLSWLPQQLPSQVKVVVSCTCDTGEPEPILAAFGRRPHHALQVEPLGLDARRQLLREVPLLSAKSLDDHQVEMLLSNPATANPLYLLVALEELRGFGSFEHLNDRIAALPRQGDAITVLFTQVLERLEEEFGRDLVRSLLEALACARRGLSERELQALTARLAGADDLFPVLRQLRPYLLYRAELLDFAHLNLRRAVRQRYLGTEPGCQAAHCRLADYFAARPLDARQVEELPWQLQQAGRWQDLYDLLADLPFFAAAWQVGSLEVKAYWARTEAATARRLEDAYRRLVEEPTAYPAGTVSHVATLLADTGHVQAALTLRRYLVDHYRQEGDQPRLGVALGHLASLLKGQGDLDGAMTLLQEAEQICRTLGNRHGIQTTLGNQARILKERGDLERAMTRLRAAEEICRELGNRYGLQIILGNQALVLITRGDLNGAMTLLQKRERLCRELGNRHGLQIALANEALVLLNQGRAEEAMPFLREAEAICHELGNRHGLQIVLGHQCRAEKERGDLDRALALAREQEQLCRQLGNRLGLQIALSNQALVWQERGAVEEALALLGESEGIGRRLHNPEGLAIVLRSKAELLAERDAHFGPALAAAEEAQDLAVRHGLTALEEQLAPLLRTLRARAQDRRRGLAPGGVSHEGPIPSARPS